MIQLTDDEKQPFMTKISHGYSRFIVYNLLEVEIIPVYMPGYGVIYGRMAGNDTFSNTEYLQLSIKLLDCALQQRNDNHKLSYGSVEERIPVRVGSETFCTTTLAGISIKGIITFTETGDAILTTIMKN